MQALESADMSNEENLQVETNVTQINTTDVCENVFVIKEVSFNFVKYEGIKSWSDNNVFEEVWDEDALKETLTGPLTKGQLVA